MIELATGRSLAVSAARDDTRFFGFPAFKVADAKHVSAPSLPLDAAMSGAFNRIKHRMLVLVERVNFHDRHTGRGVYAPHDGGVIARREISHNRRFQVVRRRYACRDDLSFLIAPPIIIGSDECAVTVVQFQGLDLPARPGLVAMGQSHARSP